MIRRLAVLALASSALAACTPASPACLAPDTACSALVCADLDKDPQHCGTCGNACASGQSCSKGKCQCAAATTQCGNICVSLDSDASNCGACGTVCGAIQFCVGGHCGYLDGTVFAACFNTGELVALDDALAVKSTVANVGAGPQSLAYAGGKLLLGDTIDDALYRFDPRATPFAREPGADKLDKVLSQIVVKGDRAYAVCSGDNLVQVIDLTRTAPVVVGDTSRVVDEIPTSIATPATPQNTNPTFAAFAGDKLYVTLLGTCDPSGDTAGNRVLELDVSTAPGKVTRELVLKAADYDKDTGVTANSPRPAGIAAVGSKLFVAIGNLNPTCLGTAGPGYLAVVDADAATLTARKNIKLPDECRNPYYVVANATHVYVTCSGAYGYGTKGEALVVVDPASEAVSKTTTFVRCADPSAVGPDACKTAVPGRMALHDKLLLIGDANSGRLLVTDLEGTIPDAYKDGVSVCALKCPGGDTSKTCYQYVSDVTALF